MKTILFVSMLAAATTVVAQNDSITDKGHWLDIVTVTGTRTPHRLSESPILTQVITADDISKLDATNLQEVLVAELPGLEFSYAMDQQVSLTMQGLGGMAILILIDGERLAGETLDNTDFLRLTTDDIDHIEIVKGAASALYGSNSVGAVVNIITRQATQGWQANINAHLGTHLEQRYGGTAGLAYGRWNSLTTVQENSIGTYDIKDRVGDGRTTVYGNRQWIIKERLSCQIDTNNLLTARGGYYFHQRDYSSYKKNRARDFSGSLRWESQLTKDDHLDISYTIDRYDKSDYYADLHKDVLNYKNVQNSLRALYTHNFDNDITWIVGCDVMSDYLKSYQFEDDGDHQQWTAGIFTQGEWQINPHWNVILGLRLDYLSKSGWQLSPKVAAKYSVGRLNFRASYSRGFRAPTLKEMYMNFDMGSIFYIYGNPNLKAEQSHSFALSGEYIKGQYSLSSTGYFNIMDNEISTLWDKNLVTDISNGSMVYENIGGRNLLGVDVSLAAKYSCGISAKLSYNYFHEFPRHSIYNLSDTRPHSIVTTIDYQKRWKGYEMCIILNGRILSGVQYYTWSDDYSATDRLTHSRAYSLWKLSLSQKFFKAYNLILSVDNLFNYRPRKFEYSSPVTTGTSFTATLSIDIDRIFNK